MIAVSIELSDDDMALLLRLAAGSGTTASELASRLFRAELGHRMRLLETTSATPGTAASADKAAPTATNVLSESDPFAYLDTSLFTLDIAALKMRWEREASDFDIWWNGLSILVREGVQESMRQSSAAVSNGQLSSASGLYIRMRE